MQILLKLPFLVLWLVVWHAYGGDQEETARRVDALNAHAEAIIHTQPDTAFFYANQALHLSTAHKYTQGLAKSHYIIGVVFYHHGVYNEALNNLLKAEQLYKTLQASKAIAKTLNQQGLVYYNTKQPSQAQACHQKALALYETLKDERGKAYSLGCLGRLYEKRSNYDKALTYQQEALALYQQLDDTVGCATIFENIGSIHEDLTHYEIAADYFKRSLHLNEITRDSLAMIVNINNIGDIYRKTSQNESALTWSHRALALATRLDDKYQMSSAYKDLSKIYHQMHNDTEAYNMLEKGRLIYDQIYAHDATRQLALMQTFFETERKNNDIKHLENDQRLNRVIKTALSGGLVMMLILGAVVFSRQQLKIRQNRKIIAQNKQVYAAQHKLMEAEIENTHLREHQLHQALDERTKSLTAHTLHIMSKNKTLEDIQQKLAALAKEEQAQLRKGIKNLLKLIEKNFVQDKDWADFRHIFEQVHTHFFEKIQQHAPDLTHAETRLASLIKLNLPSKDIALILGISTDSLRIARYRLRKKLKLEQGASLASFIHSL